MTRAEICENLNNVFREVFDSEDINVNDTTTASDIEGWDSLQHINLIVAIEAKFGIKFTMNDMADMQSVGDMIALIEGRAT